ncbi:hypothetical protein CPBP_00408 [Candidatus Bodocaedibacter vickermanii]|uniref:Uncharacterized protein n=2 Tax=Candidatus Bodocaedibacter vickermanii TaxID=2741701 RepID=A0A7L9RSU0_9PROT|nr:hypothetical protein CPBP_00408 [Candidatus Paracaedibacteraceae bacterium 'Lake Konstanz']
MLMCMHVAKAGLFSPCVCEDSESLYKTSVEKGGNITITHLVFAAAASPELVNVSCDVVVNDDEKTLKILLGEGVSLEEKRFTVIKSWLAKTLADVEKYTWEISVE